MALLLVCVLVLSLSVPVDADERDAKRELEVQPISWLVEQKSRWEGWASIGRPAAVEGRYAFRSGNRLRMRGCALEFLVPKGALARVPRDTKTLEIRGRFAERDGEAVFAVDSVRALPSDESRFTTRMAGLDVEDFAGRYALAEWAENRGNFYGDEKLLALAGKARRSGFRTERRSLPDEDAEARLALAERAQAFGLEREGDALVHEALRLEWDRLRERDDAGLKAFRDRLAKTLEGARKPLEKPDPLLEASYRKSPLKFYEESDDAARLELQRLFYVRVVLDQLLDQVDADDPESGRTVAAKIDERLPERREVAERLRDAALDTELERVGGYTRDELGDLVGRLKQRDRSKDATLAVARWLESRETVLRRAGADGLLQMADYYHNLTDDEEKVVALLREAHRQNPNSPEVRERFQRRGYVLRNGEWAPRDESRPAESVDRSVRTGMSPEEVRSVLGAPQGTTRVLSREQVTEVWIYGPRDAAGLAVHFERDRVEPAERARVARVVERRPE